MLNCLQVKNIMAASPEELQEDLNTILKDLGTRVQKIDFLNPYQNSFGCTVTYWSQDIPAEMTAKIEELPEDPEALPGDPVFVCVLHDYQRHYVLHALKQQEDTCKIGAMDQSGLKTGSERERLRADADIYKNLQKRFEDDNQPEMIETQGPNIP